MPAREAMRPSSASTSRLFRRRTPAAHHDRGWTRTSRASSVRADSEADYDADLPSSYEIVDVNSKFCAGTVVVRNACAVVVQPVPTLETSFTPMNDACNAETGSIVPVCLTGAPPFAVPLQVPPGAFSARGFQNRTAELLSRSSTMQTF